MFINHYKPCFNSHLLLHQVAGKFHITKFALGFLFIYQYKKCVGFCFKERPLLTIELTSWE